MASPRSNSRAKSKRSKSTSATATRNIAAAVKSPTASPVKTIEAKPVPSATGVTQQAIAEAAYFLWQQRGGNEVVNWLEAEATLRTHIMGSRV